MDHSEYEAAIKALASVSEARRDHVWSALHYAVAAYELEARWPEPQLSCLRVALRALTGALRDRMGE